MEKSTLWSLRLGFSTKQAEVIQKKGINEFLQNSFYATFDLSQPAFLSDVNQSLADFKTVRNMLKTATDEEKKILLKKEIKANVTLKSWWIDKMRDSQFPLREKMVGFWQNHFVVTSQKVKSSYWIFQHNNLLRENAFGNFRELTKKVVYSNAMLRYLDNVENKKDKINENLSRELLELFTIGIGNYSEEDIKNGAKALAGLNLGEEQGMYRKFQEDNSLKTFFNKSGNFKANDIIDIIFEQKQTAYLLTKKILKWFIYDNPSQDLVTYYGDFLRKVDYEIQPFLEKIFTEEYTKNTEGSKIKNPLEYILPILETLNSKSVRSIAIYTFLKQQGMDLYNQVNVKGWDGGNSWLTSQVYLQRNNIADALCNGRTIFTKQQSEGEIMQNQIQESMQTSDNKTKKEVTTKFKIDFDINGTNKKIIADLALNSLFQINSEVQEDMEAILKYDFNPKEESADYAVNRLYNYIVKLPEFQLI
ncbi:MAG: hypothetical protein ACI9XR_001494 [Flavobacterium sp.]|jgi:uncharacterized protein (DUF1800 family)